MPKTTVNPDASMLIASPLITWSPLCVTHAKAWMREANIDIDIPANRPIHADPETNAMDPAANAEASILPSRPISIIPLRSEKIPAIAHKINGVDTLNVESKVDKKRKKYSIINLSLYQLN